MCCQALPFTDETVQSHLCVLVGHHIHQTELPFVLCEMVLAVADFLQSVWNDTDFSLP